MSYFISQGSERYDVTDIIFSLIAESEFITSAVSLQTCSPCIILIPDEIPAEALKSYLSYIRNLSSDGDAELSLEEKDLLTSLIVAVFLEDKEYLRLIEDLIRKSPGSICLGPEGENKLLSLSSQVKERLYNDFVLPYDYLYLIGFDKTRRDLYMWNWFNACWQIYLDRVILSHSYYSFSLTTLVLDGIESVVYLVEQYSTEGKNATPTLDGVRYAWRAEEESSHSSHSVDLAQQDYLSEEAGLLLLVEEYKQGRLHGSRRTWHPCGKLEMKKSQQYKHGELMLLSA